MLHYARSYGGTSNLNTRNLSKAAETRSSWSRHLTAKTGTCHVIKRFLSENPGFLPGIRIFPEFFYTILPRLISGFRKTKLYENPLRIVGGDSKHRNLFNDTHNIEIYILIPKSTFVNLMFYRTKSVWYDKLRENAYFWSLNS